MQAYKVSAEAPDLTKKQQTVRIVRTLETDMASSLPYRNNTTPRLQRVGTSFVMVNGAGEK
tara:strand:- start:308 stop:490 length:183 start_codon:yes stop_codon:yes gene_type:complete